MPAAGAPPPREVAAPTQVALTIRRPSSAGPPTGAVAGAATATPPAAGRSAPPRRCPGSSLERSLNGARSCFGGSARGPRTGVRATHRLSSVQQNGDHDPSSVPSWCALTARGVGGRDRLRILRRDRGEPVYR